MSSFPEERPTKFVVLYSDRADDDLDKLNLFQNRLDPDRAERWDMGLRQVVDELTEFPGPLSHARDNDASDYFHREVRRLLYYGPTRRRGVPVRILFTLLPPDPADPPEKAETVIFLLRLLHGSQSLLAEEAPEP